MKDKQHLSEMFRIIEGALKLDGEKVKNYANLLADKIEADGNASSAKRLRQLISQNPARQLKPAYFQHQNSSLPVDDESRFQLLQHIELNNQAEYVYANHFQQQTIEDFLAVLNAREILESQGVSCGTSLLLYGPPGCGKTFLASHIAKVLNLPLFLARLDGLISSYLGSTSKNIRAILEFAARTPCILFLDEFDAIAKLRDDQQELGELKRVVNSFLQNLDMFGKEIILIAATNHEQLLDTAVWRRFQFQLHIDLPTFSQREHFWRVFSSEGMWSAKDVKVLADISAESSVSAIETAAVRLRQRSIIYGEKPSLRDAALTLLSLSPAQMKSHFMTLDMLNDADALTDNLKKRDPELYSLSIISEIAGVSKATMSRHASEAQKARNLRENRVENSQKSRKARGSHGK